MINEKVPDDDYFDTFRTWENRQARQSHGNGMAARKQRLIIPFLELLDEICDLTEIRIHGG